MDTVLRNSGRAQASRGAGDEMALGGHNRGAEGGDVVPPRLG